MPRPPATVPSALADLARALPAAEGVLPAPVLRALGAIVERARRAILDAIARDGMTATAARIGVHRVTLSTWCAAGGWLRIDDDPAQGAP